MSDVRPIVAVDPGQSKCGVAVVLPTGEVCHRDIVPSEDVADAIVRLQDEYDLEAVVVGDKTAAAPVREAIESACPGLALATVDEHLSSRAARERYVEDHPPRGLWRLVPRGLRVPDRPYDDYAAIILAERYWERTISNQGSPNAPRSS